MLTYSYHIDGIIQRANVVTHRVNDVLHILHGNDFYCYDKSNRYYPTILLIFYIIVITVKCNIVITMHISVIILGYYTYVLHKHNNIMLHLGYVLL